MINTKKNTTIPWLFVYYIKLHFFAGIFSSIGIARKFVMIASLVLIILFVGKWGCFKVWQFSQWSLKRSTQVHTRQKLATTHVTL